MIHRRSGPRRDAGEAPAMAGRRHWHRQDSASAPPSLSTSNSRKNGMANSTGSRIDAGSASPTSDVRDPVSLKRLAETPPRRRCPLGPVGSATTSSSQPMIRVARSSGRYSSQAGCCGPASGQHRANQVHKARSDTTAPARRGLEFEGRSSRPHHQIAHAKRSVARGRHQPPAAGSIRVAQSNRYACTSAWRCCPSANEWTASGSRRLRLHLARFAADRGRQR